MLRLSLIAALAGALVAGSAAAETAAADAVAVATAAANVLRVRVSGVTSPGGHVRVEICRKDEFLKDCRISGAAVAVPGTTTVVVPNVPPGVYAAQVYHDRNDNHEVDRNFLGLPTEGVGFSNNAEIHLHAPSFSSAAFKYEGGDETIALKLQHFAQ